MQDVSISVCCVRPLRQIFIITFYNYFSVGSRVVNSNSPRGNIRSGSAIYTLVGWYKTKSTTMAERAYVNVNRVCVIVLVLESVCVFVKERHKFMGE